MKKFLSDDYVNLYNLVTHHDERKMNDTFHRSMFVVMMLRCLKKLGYFGEDVKMKASNEEETEVFTEDEIYIATLLCHFLELMQFNSHEVAQVTTDGLRKFRTKWKLIMDLICSSYI